MRPNLTAALWVLASIGCVTTAAAQATGMPSYNAPYRAFTRSEIGVSLSFPNGGGTAIEGVYRMASGKFDLGFRGGLFDPGGSGNAELLVGAEGRSRIVTHTEDFPLDGALVLGIGGHFASGANALIVPVGLSLGRRVDPKGSKISIVPYVQPTGFFTAGNGTSDFFFALGLGADFRLSPKFDARISAGLGDLEGVSISAVWLH
ncbi:MAG: hypothetical protein DMD54_14795 [Gemmatimonadetes bacterium]|nr:MAG: hypothetical protein DMD54_14795 [Gemmatimonadota bacterium]